MQLLNEQDWRLKQRAKFRSEMEKKKIIGKDLAKQRLA